MQSPYKKVVVYDLETGGLNHKFNNITELAAVAINLETLEIVEEFSVMIYPQINLSDLESEPIKEAKVLYKNLATKDEETNITRIEYKGQHVTLKNLEVLVEDIEVFYDLIKSRTNNFITYAEYLELRKKKELTDILGLYFDKTYNPQALEITHIPKELLIEEGVPYEKAFKLTSEFFKRHVSGNSKPILSGHNIKKFDNAFFEKFFESNSDNLKYYINDTQMIDTLEWARLRWFELSGFNLGTCANEVGLTLKEAHRALPDTVANAKFLIKMLQNLRGEGSQESTYVKRKYNFNF